MDSAEPGRLEVDSLKAGYGHVKVLHSVNLEVRAGELIVILGPNGAGKTTLLRAMTGLASVQGGDVRVRGLSVVGRSPNAIAGVGIAQVPEGRRLFGSLTVRDNIEVALYPKRKLVGAAHRRELLEEVYCLFPVLATRAMVAASALSGGEQQMLALARAFVQEPAFLLLDEPLSGLAPIVVTEIMRVLRDRATVGNTGVLVVEQSALPLALADRAYVLRRGVVVAEGPAAKLSEDMDLRTAYLA